MPATITVRREVLDVELHGSEADGVALQRRLSDVCADVLAPALEAAFARVDPDDAHLTIERLALDLAEVSLDRLDAELTDAVYREVADYLRRNPVPSGPGTTSETGEAQCRTPVEAVDEALLVFLRTGRLPWSFRVPPGSRLEQVVLDAWAGDDAGRGPPPVLRARLAEALALPGVRARLIAQFSPELAITVLRSLTPAVATTVDGLRPALAEIASESPAGIPFGKDVWGAALLAAATGRRPGPSELARTAWSRLPSTARADAVLTAAVERHWPGVTEHHAAPRVVDEVGPLRPSPTPSPSPTPRPGQADDDVDGMLVDNAGIVLVHPFLPRFFAGLGLATADELVEPGRTVCLLHHLATGELTAPEHRLTLAKILCGLPLDEPTEADVGLTETETEEATVLLAAAIGHWGALGGSSPDALRSEFLMRPGALAVDADGDWVLRVEARAVDVLLDRLPWGLSFVDLPWVEGLLRVEWR